jgi:hypothetical protein
MTTIKEKNITFEEALQMPELAHFHEVIRYLERTPFSEAFPKKYEKSLERMVSEHTFSLFKEQPSLPLKTVITTTLQTLPDDLSAKLILKMTKLTIQKWEDLTH